MRKSAQKLGIGDYQLWRIERPDEIFAFREIHAGLAADRAIDLRHESRRNMHQADTSQVGGRGKSGYVTDHTAADRDDRRLTVCARSNQLARDLLDAREMFRGFAVVEENHRDAIAALPAQVGNQLPTPMLPHTG